MFRDVADAAALEDCESIRTRARTVFHTEDLEPELAMSKIIVFCKMHLKFQAKSGMDIAKNECSVQHA